jgi:hypothetical protein
LALSGGRKGMAVMALFAALRKDLDVVYHTIITDKELDRQISLEWEFGVFGSLSQRDKNERLFLRAYKEYDEKGVFHLFRVPMASFRVDTKPDQNKGK